MRQCASLIEPHNESGKWKHIWTHCHVMDDATLSLLLSFLLSPDGKIFFGDNVKVGLLKFETEKSRIIFWVSYVYKIHGITYDMVESHMVTSIKIDCQSAMPFSKVPLNCGGHPIDQKLFLIGDFLVINWVNRTLRPFDIRLGSGTLPYLRWSMLLPCYNNLIEVAMSCQNKRFEFDSCRICRWKTIIFVMSSLPSCG